MSRGIATAQVKSVSYDAESKVLAVRFMHVGHYEYAGVPEKIGDVLMTAPPEEVVHTFNDKVEGKYKSTRIGD